MKAVSTDCIRICNQCTSNCSDMFAPSLGEVFNSPLLVPEFQVISVYTASEHVPTMHNLVSWMSDA